MKSTFGYMLLVFRPSDRHWRGLWRDLVTEQTLMCSIKTHGGLTGGRGVSESVHHMWTLSLNLISSVHFVMMDLMDMVVKTNDQHVDLTEPRRKKAQLTTKTSKRG